MIAGYYRGWADRVIEVVTNILLAFPALLLAIFIVTFSDNPNSTSSAGDDALHRADHPRAVDSVRYRH